jgi:hypothetical protein
MSATVAGHSDSGGVKQLGHAGPDERRAQQVAVININD